MNVNLKSVDLQKHKIRPPVRDGSQTERRANSTSRGARVLSAHRSQFPGRIVKPQEEEFQAVLTERQTKDLERTAPSKFFV